MVLRWTRVGLFLVILWGGAFAISFLVAQWRSPDLGQVEEQIGRLRDDVEAISSRTSVPAAPGEVPAPDLKRAPLTPGTEVTLGRARITVVSITSELGPAFKPGEARVEFILQGPHEGGLAQEFKVVDQEGFLCESGINAEVGTPLGPGEKTRVWIYYKCAEGARPNTLSLDGVTFDFPQP
jgi:hypothetical protein